MKVLFLGDINGRSGRKVVLDHVPRLRKDLDLDAVVVNGENAAHGFGISNNICDELLKKGIDIVTTGNHVWDQRETLTYITKEPRLLRPVNYPPGTPGRGIGKVETAAGTLIVINALGRLFMDAMDDPFRFIDQALETYKLGKNVSILVDFHAETTSEKQALGYFLDGRVSCVVGSHTHCPTSDTRILPKGTGFQTDAGMCGDYNSVIGMQIEAPIQRFTTKLPSDRLSPAEGPGTLSGIYFETDDQGLTKKIAPVCIGPHLINAMP